MSVLEGFGPGLRIGRDRGWGTYGRFHIYMMKQQT